MIATHPLVPNRTMVPVPRADWTITKTKHQEQKNLTQLEKQIEEYCMLIWFLQLYFEIQNWMNGKDYSHLSSLEFLTSQSSLAEECRIWLSRYIKSATRIQNLQARDTIFKCINWDCQTIRRSLRLFTCSVPLQNKWGRWPTAAAFPPSTLAVTFCLCVHATTKSIEFLQTWYHDVLLCFDDKHTSHFVNNWYLLTFTSLILT